MPVPSNGNADAHPRSPFPPLPLVPSPSLLPPPFLHPGYALETIDVLGCPRDLPQDSLPNTVLFLQAGGASWQGRGRGTQSAVQAHTAFSHPWQAEPSRAPGTGAGASSTAPWQASQQAASAFCQSDRTIKTPKVPLPPPQAACLF